MKFRDVLFRKICKKYLVSLVCGTAIMLLIACGGGGGGSNPPPFVDPFGKDQQFEGPTWKGSFEVGTRTYHFVDQDRGEPHTTREDDHREILVRIFYPATTTPGLKQMPVMDSFMWSNFGIRQSDGPYHLRQSNYQHATWDIWEEAEALPGPFPVLVFSHGYGLGPESHVAIAAELASQGFIVASINHPYGSMYSLFPDNRIVRPHDYHGNEEANDLWSPDQSFCIDQLEIFNADSNGPFFERMNLEKIGVLGHSFGGTASFYTSNKDPRISAAANLEGGNEMVDIPIPFMYVEGATNQLPVLDWCRDDGYHVYVKGISHISFCDIPLYFHWDHSNKNLRFGNLNILRANEVIATTCVQFFEKYLKDTPAPWLDDADEKPEEIEITQKQR